MKKYKVYCLRDKNGEIKYVGQTRQSLSKRLRGHRDNKNFPTKEFTIELIADFDTPEPMYKLEGMLIQQYDLVNNGWNKAYGYSEMPKQHNAEGFNNSFYGHKHRQETKDLIGLQKKGNSYAKGNKSRTGRKNSENHKKIVSEKKSKKVMCLETGEVFKSGREAAKKLNLQRSKISNVCKGKRKSTGGYTFCFID